MRSFIVIPARLASTRLPRKLLLCETGRTLIEHTFCAASTARKPAGVLVATDSEEILREVQRFGGKARMTSPDCSSGTDRVAEITRVMPDVDIVVNVQGDEPEIAGTAIDQVIEILERDTSAAAATLATPIRDRRLLNDPACVKVVFDHDYRALYFSRSPIPHAREFDEPLLSADPPCFYQHIGLYAYRREFLLQLAELPPTQLEVLEGLEQLRVLQYGYTMLVGVVAHAAVGIDTAEDYRKFVERCRVSTECQAQPSSTR